MFKGRIVSCSNVNGKMHTFQKDFDDYDEYQTFVSTNPEYSTQSWPDNWWSPWTDIDRYLPLSFRFTNIPVDTQYLPDGVDLNKYQNRLREKRETEAEKTTKRYALERSRDYLKDYIAENTDDTEAKADLEKIEKEIKTLESKKTPLIK